MLNIINPNVVNLCAWLMKCGTQFEHCTPAVTFLIILRVFHFYEYNIQDDTVIVSIILCCKLTLLNELGANFSTLVLAYVFLINYTIWFMLL